MGLKNERSSGRYRNVGYGYSFPMMHAAASLSQGVIGPSHMWMNGQEI
jgi:hypothetical protein